MVALSLLTKEIYRIRRQLKKKAVNILPGELGSDDAVEATMAAVTAMETAGMTKEDAEASVYDNILVLSVRKGMAKLERKYTAADVNGWGVIGWLNKDGNHPLIDFFSQASADIVDMDAQMLFGVLGCERNYLRIQTETLTGDTLLMEMDYTTKSNMESLMMIGKKVLKVERGNIATGVYEPVAGGATNEEALLELAGKLCEDHRLRKTTSSK